MNKKCKECNNEVEFMDDSYRDDINNTGFYLCRNCHEQYSIEEIESED